MVSFELLPRVFRTPATRRILRKGVSISHTTLPTHWLAALRLKGYRPANRYIVFQALAHTLGLPAAQWRVLAKCHEERNKTEYQGFAEVDETLLENLIEITGVLLDKVHAER